LNSWWGTFYTTINRSNVVLTRVPGIPNMSESSRTKILAEARFLRAFSYFHLARDFGPVPLRTTETVGTSEIASPRASLDQIYSLIISDLQVAEKDLPETVGANTGRASQWAAKMLLARVYLERKDWPKAAEKANEVILSNKFSLVPVATSNDFYNIFATVTNSEDIMSHHSSLNRFSNFSNWMHGAGTPYNRGTVWGFTLLPNMNAPLIRNWDNRDLRKNFNLYSSYVNDRGETVTLPPSNPWLFKKFIKDPNGNATYSIPIFRLAEAYLMFAEASAMATGSPTALALERLNVVKRRAYGYTPHSPSPVDYPAGMSQTQFVNTVLQERAYEFMLEMIRWWDLRRTGKAKEIIEATGKPFNNHRLLYPIPQIEIDNNPAISQSDQNTGY